ncbi:gamma-glutamyl-gamma-aminobutyrate hydrolase family protein [Hydrogenophaga taeniospiralis]|jgi:putative glutamine amidotransferase|uniref:gamma-glutamyl-gamma-aminobutyrate hydrolase family protein n=1 Tax=Hydrogenophaga taeniospiralis TaxID=65656 RepID=UPI001CFB59E9|nr:gamma-glutamyl-gamma-aminobutyrate hydrolase family protein [Hydrogenophaga taeniospiralis]MCB4362845.1 gamma-glutamyl-gamma-aminobutyrate hydrolase family protein [Hydrogenophaga taeniospiralis]
MNQPPCMVWLPADHRLMGDHGHQMPFLLLGDKYARAVKVGAQAQPVMFPLADAEQIPELLSLVDGVMLTGSPSNVHPSHFDEDVADPSLPLDLERDTLTLALVKACVHEGVPLLGVCRGFQEINVALGGTLHQRVHEVPGLMDHREPKTAPYEEQYAPSHPIRFEPGSIFETWAGGPETMVNSLHGQGINRLAPGLEAMAHAPDGVVEAFAVKGARTFAYAMQFHPEWRCWETPFYAAIFEEFGRACRSRQSLRLQAADLARSRATIGA